LKRTLADLGPPAAFFLLTAIGVGRLFPVYTTFSATQDEPYHVASGMELIDKGAYTYELQHPPLARVAVALGPYLSGLRSHSIRSSPYDEGNAILYSSGDPVKNVKLARLGSLPFFVLGCAVVFMWGWRWFGPPAAVIALALFVCLPPILGHAALATNDMACAATVAFALYEFVRWLEKPDKRRAAWFGAAVALAFLSKFSSVLFLPLCFIAAYFVIDKKLIPRGQTHLATAVAVALLMIWAGYRFSLRPASPVRGQHAEIDKRVANPVMRRVAYAAVDTPLPLRDAVAGVVAVAKHDRVGHPSYLLGQYRRTGWWYFFPVVLAVKTPMAFLILAIAGMVAVLWRRAAVPWQQRLTAFFAIAILVACMASRIDLGVRHILAIYPLLAVLAGYAVVIFAQKTRWLAIAAGLLVGWAAADSFMAHPDYLAYFNGFASRHPEKVLCESDLDWGQDLYRLRDALRAHGVNQVAIRYFGTAPLDRAGLPPHRELSPSTPSSGWAAISLHALVMENAENGSFEWLKQYQPVERVGKSIYLYRLP
jgi:hypothetical protein